MEDVKSAAHALNIALWVLYVRAAASLSQLIAVCAGIGVATEVSVAEGDDFEAGLMSPKVRDTLMGKKAGYSDGSKEEGARGGMCGCFTLAYYKPYFDVDTVDVQQRLTRALLPFKKNPTFAEMIAPSPDAYGPFWLSTTLIFCLASCSNVASYMDFNGDISEWSYDFSRLASAYTLVEIFLFGLPVLLWLLGKYMSVPMTLSFLLCLYGYSMAIFIPASIACMAPADGFDWVVLLLSMAWSLFFLLNNLWSVISEHLSKEKMLPVLAFIRHLT
ncbi:Yipf1 protein, partial [Globisporangium splendens]